MTNSIGKLTTVCMTGAINDKGVFVAAKDTKMGTVTRKSMMQIIGIDDPDLLTVELVQQYIPQLKAKLLPKVKQNLNALYNQLLFVADMPEMCHSLRISSDLLPLFDHPELSHVYDAELLHLVDVLLARCKRVIDKHEIVVSTHPSAYCIPNSEYERVRINAFRTLYYHKYFMERLTTADQTCININVEGNLDHIPEFDAGLYGDLLPWLSFENSDKNGRIFTGDTLNTLDMCERYGVKMVYDLHHHVVMTGEYLSVNDDTFSRILATWKHQTPFFHASQSRDDNNIIQAHSDMITDDYIIQQIADLLHFGIVDIESKHKTDAVLGVYNLVQPYLDYEM